MFKYKKILKHFRHNILPLIISLGLFITPFFFWPKNRVPFEVPKVQLITFWVEITIAAAVLTFKKTDLRIHGKGINIILASLIFLLFVIISSVHGVNPLKSFTGNTFRNDGIITLIHLIAFLIVIHLFINKKRLILLIKSVSLSNAILSSATVGLWILVNVFKFFSIPNWSGAVGATFGNPNFLAGYLLVTLPFGLFLCVSTKNPQKSFWLIAVISQILGILATQSLAGLLGLLIISSGFFIIRGQTSKKIISFTVSSAIIIWFAFYFITQKGINPNNFVAESRQRIFAKAAVAFGRRPILGWGWANFDKAFESVEWPVKMKHDVYVDKAHSNILEVLVTTGLLGLIVYLAILVKAVVNFSNKRSLLAKYLLFSLIIYIVHSQTNVTSISEELIFWLLLAFASKPEALLT